MLALQGNCGRVDLARGDGGVDFEMADYKLDAIALAVEALAVSAGSRH